MTIVNRVTVFRKIRDPLGKKGWLFNQSLKFWLQLHNYFDFRNKVILVPNRENVNLYEEVVAHVIRSVLGA